MRIRVMLFAIILGNIFFNNVLKAESNELVLANSSKTDYVIVLREAPIPAEENAAKELQKYLKKISGAEFPIVADDGNNNDKNKIFIGAGNSVKSILPDLPWDKMYTDRIILETVGKDLVLAGSRPRGALYAVYTFLEEVLGCRWWTAKESYIPKVKKLTIPELNIDYSPVFNRLRNPYYRETFASPEFSAKLRCLFQKYYNRGEKWGGGVNVTGNHTSYKLISPKKYFKDHPEWYSMIRGKRTHKHGQLCYTNDKLLKEMIKNVRAILADQPNSIVMIGQEDHQGDSRCQCPKCLAVEKEEGAMSGPLIRFVNKVAENIEKDFPQARIMTFAYLYTQKPPKKVKPRKNVIIMLCSFESYRWHFLNSDQNAEFRDDFKKWSSISNEIFIWDYRTNFNNYLEIYPNLETLEGDLKFFANNKVSGVFEQGDRLCEIGDFVRMRTWVTAHLLWNPNQNQDALIKEFLNGYYKEAAPFLWKYLKLVNNSGMHAGKTTASPKPKVLLKAARFYKKALEAVKHDEIMIKRVLRARTSLETSTLQLALLGIDVDNVITMLGYQDKQQLLSEFKAKCEKNKKSAYKEGGNDRTLPYIAARYEKIANEPKVKSPKIPGVDIRKYRWFDIQENTIGAHRSSSAKHVLDSEASNGMAALMKGNKDSWNVAYIMQGSVMRAYDITRATIYISAKVLLEGSPDPDDIAFSFGIHNDGTNETTQRHIRYKDIQGKSYQFYSLKDIPVDMNCYIWTCASGKNVKQIFFDRIILVKE